MEHRKKKEQQQQQQEEEEFNDHIRRSRSPKLSIALDLVNKSSPSPPRVDGIRSLLSRKIIIEKKIKNISLKLGDIHSFHEHIAQPSPSVGSVPPVERKFSDPEFLPIPESIARGDEGTAFLGARYQGRVARW
jgi:hypothetical protein